MAKCFQFAVGVVLYSAAFGAAFGQEPAAVPQKTLIPAQVQPGGTPNPEPGTGPEDDAKSRAERGLPASKPLTALEERERQIRLLDPLARDDRSNTPTLRRNTQDGNVAGPGQGGDPQLRSVYPGLPPVSPAQRSVGIGDQSQTGDRSTEGPRVVSLDGDPDAPIQYNGPAVLSRNYSLSRNAGQQRVVKWAWNVGLSESWDSGILGLTTPVTLTSLQIGVPVNNSKPKSSVGRTFLWSFTGRHKWKHDEVSGSFTGNNIMYSGAQSYGGNSYSAATRWAHVLNRRMLLNSSFNGQILSQSASLENSLTLGSNNSVANLNLAASPITQIGDLGSKQMSVTTGIQYLYSSRVSFGIDLGYTALQRVGFGGLGSTGLTQSFDVNYRLSARRTIGLYYAHSAFLYSQHLSLSDINTFGGQYSWLINRSLQLAAKAGVSEIESDGIARVAIDPQIAILLGRSSGLINAYFVSTVPDFSFALTRSFGTARSLRASYTQSVAPAVGTTSTSSQSASLIGYTTRLFRSYRSTASVGTTSVNALQAAGTGLSSNNNSKFFAVSISRTFQRGVSSSLTFDYRSFNNATTPNLHDQFRISYSLAWGPGEGKLW